MTRTILISFSASLFLGLSLSSYAMEQQPQSRADTQIDAIVDTVFHQADRVIWQTYACRTCDRTELGHEILRNLKTVLERARKDASVPAQIMRTLEGIDASFVDHVLDVYEKQQRHHTKTVHHVVLKRLLETGRVFLLEEVEISPYTCFTYAFAKVLAVEQNTLLAVDILEAIKEHVKNGILVEVSQPQLGDLVLYQKDGIITHAGVFINPRLIESKWSAYSFIFQHEPGAVPSAYGSITSHLRKSRLSL